MEANAEQLLRNIACATIPDVRSYLVRVPTGTTVFRAGDQCRNGLIVLAGRVRVDRIAANGHEAVLYRVCAGDACAISTACVLGMEPYPADGHVEHDVSALVLPREVFCRHIAPTPPPETVVR